MGAKCNKTNKSCRPVRDVGTGIEYESITAAAKALGIPINDLWIHLNGGRISTRGHKLEYAGPRREKDIKNAVCGAAKRVPVLDTTTGIIYGSVNEAAIALDTTASNMSYHINGNSQTLKGHVLIKCHLITEKQ